MMATHATMVTSSEMSLRRSTVSQLQLGDTPWAGMG